MILRAGPPPEVVAITAIVFVTIGAIGFPLARAFARRIEGNRNAPPALGPAVEARLERIERAVEAIAVEVERISEGQRFVTKVMAERTADPRLPPSPR